MIREFITPREVALTAMSLADDALQDNPRRFHCSATAIVPRSAFRLPIDAFSGLHIAPMVAVALKNRTPLVGAIMSLPSIPFAAREWRCGMQALVVGQSADPESLSVTIDLECP